MQPATALLFAEVQLAGADIRHRQSPAALLQHHGAQPVVTPCRQHPLLQHRPRRQHPGDVAAQQGPFGGGGFQLIAEGDAIAAPHQLGAVALGGVVGQARHRHPPHAFAGILACQGQLQQARQQDRVLKEALKEVPQPVEQHPLWLGRLELYVMAQHRGQGRRIHQAVVVPAGQVRVGFGAVAVVLGRLPLRCCLRLPRRQLHRRLAGGLGALARAGGGIGLQGRLIRQGAWAAFRRHGLAGAASGCWGEAGRSGHAGGAEQISLADGVRHQRQLQFGWGRHGAGGGGPHPRTTPPMVFPALLGRTPWPGSSPSPHNL